MGSLYQNTQPTYLYNLWNFVDNFDSLCIQGVKKVSNILRSGNSHQKKFYTHGSGNAYFVSSVHLFIVAKNKKAQYWEKW